AFRRATEIAPGFAKAHYNLGNALRATGKLDQAVAEYQRAVELDAGYALAHGALGQVLLEQGRFAEARAATRRCLELLPEGHPLRPDLARQLRQCERFAALDAKLPALLAGEIEPADTAERLALAQLCGQYRRRHAAAAR